MHIKKIYIENYKGFENTSLQFHPRLNVFIGNNASGKSSLLQALIKSVYETTSQFAQDHASVRKLRIQEDEINYNAKSCYISTVAEQFLDFDETVQFVAFKNQQVLVMNDQKSKEVNLNSRFINWLRVRLNQNATIPIFKFYPANRGAVTYSEKTFYTNFSIRQVETWSHVYQSDISYSDFFRWFFDYETRELRLQRDANNFSVQDPNLKGVRDALNKALDLIGYGKVRVKTEQISRQESSKLSPTLLMENLDTGKKDYLEYKSDGEKAIITLVADISYHLALAKNFEDNDVFLDSPGVIMIDEIESHLHPNWQREIIPILIQVFPNIQFFIATHSPQVIASVNSESVFSIEKFDPELIHMKSKGEDTNTLLKYLFAATERPKPYISLIEKFKSLMDENAPYEQIDAVIKEISTLEQEDKATDISSLLDELRLRFEAHKFEREYEKDH
jgi:predicted ATP-binding protein involved in virulence